jgi:predicted metalloendopeptidase
MKVTPGLIQQSALPEPLHSARKSIGQLGAGLGHEVTHGFDDNGALFDAHASALK